MAPFFRRVLNVSTSLIKKRKFSGVPPSLTGPPVCSLAPPGACQFGPERFASAPLLRRHDVSPTSSVYTFGLPDAARGLGLSTCACLLARAATAAATGAAEEEVVRPYTPISTNEQTGTFDLLVKTYPDGKMSGHLRGMAPGDTLGFKHIAPNVKIQAPFPQRDVAMLAGGTGITPMVQALHAILGDPAAHSRVTLLYGSRRRSEILGKELLDAWEASYPDRLRVVHVISEDDDGEEDGGGAAGYRRGHIDAGLIREMLPPPGKKGDVVILICGPPPMYDVLSGPRDEKKVTGVLKDCGYTDDQVYKF
mmetsp:Transcript_38560/g.75262  ORF Transcript_38560/g.75262 Transcript_38560/m.75262 type:complete len:308 (+) Transcript_38560:97-1020(+)